MGNGQELRSSLDLNGNKKLEPHGYKNKNETKESNTISEILKKLNRTIKTFAIVTLGTLAVSNISNDYSYGAAFQKYFYVLPTLTRKDIKVKENSIYVDGKKFKLFEKNIYYYPNGTRNKPFTIQQKGIINREYGDPSDGIADINFMLMQQVKADWKENSPNYSANLDSSIAKYKGLGYYCFQVGISLPYTNTKYNSGEKILYFETPKPVNYKEFLVDINVLYKINKTNAQFYGDSNKVFVKRFIQDEDYLHGLMYGTGVGYSKVGNLNYRYFIFGKYTYVELPEVKIIKFSDKNKFSDVPLFKIKNLLTVYKEVPLAYQIHYIPGYGDGTKSFPFKMNSSSTWRGPGYYYFPGIKGAFIPRFRTLNKVYNEKYLKKIYNKVYSKDYSKNLMSYKNMIYSGVMIKGKMFFYSES
ncbi:MAG: hypothetical protein QXD23_02700, partial [Candidatus Micrarchaeaceae archaeon]